MPFRYPKPFILLTVIIFAGALFGCQSVSLSPVKDSITFIDTQKFDTELANSLVNSKNPVDVDFYNPVNPNQIPPRLEKWIAVSEATGGKITVTQPPNELAPRDPVLLLGLFTGIWQAIKLMSGQYSSYTVEEGAKKRDVNIALARNSQGELFVQKVIFTPRETKWLLFLPLLNV
jgi:hypothetical protein